MNFFHHHSNQNRFRLPLYYYIFHIHPAIISSNKQKNLTLLNQDMILKLFFHQLMDFKSMMCLLTIPFHNKTSFSLQLVIKT